MQYMGGGSRPYALDSTGKYYGYYMSSNTGGNSTKTDYNNLYTSINFDEYICGIKLKFISHSGYDATYFINGYEFGFTDSGTVSKWTSGENDTLGHDTYTFPSTPLVDSMNKNYEIVIIQSKDFKLKYYKNGIYYHTLQLKNNQLKLNYKLHIIGDNGYSGCSDRSSFFYLYEVTIIEGTDLIPQSGYTMDWSHYFMERYLTPYPVYDEQNDLYGI